MAVKSAIIETVRVWGADGVGMKYPWKAGVWYLIRDDYPYLDILTRGSQAYSKGDIKLEPRDEASEEGTQWQRWNLEPELARKRRLGEISLALNLPKDCTLRCYVVPSSLLSYRDVVTMVEDIEEELGFAAAWDMLAERPERSWSRHGGHLRSNMPAEAIRVVEEEFLAALAIRRDPFTEPGPRSRIHSPLAENAIVSHWAARRSGQLRDVIETTSSKLKQQLAKSDRNSPLKRQERIDAAVARLTTIMQRLVELRSVLARLVVDIELGTSVYPSPLFQRDHRLRLLLRVFAPPTSQALSEIESPRSHYPPVFLNDLWEIWGAVWIVKELRRLGFSGFCSTASAGLARGCSWRLSRGDIVLELDFEPEPVLVDFANIPPVHERNVPALEWAARHQEIDSQFPFLGTEEKCSPDYLLRITTPARNTLLVGDACLASAKHHGKKTADAKPYAVERYRRTIGWSVEDRVVRCHPLGGFVVFPSPASAWAAFERLPGASDCTLLCPSPNGDPEASRRLEAILIAVAPEIQDGDCAGRPADDI
ncbi:hypothetical protein SAMN04515666_111173 [Bosea lupini]|uniref:Uncharacterized protein n=1 Tax=Bosea lupini TaxID=1036779 RepID=A0A1H7YF87_9HYPH|nr:hypothetical protein [Bosea lupini]SEM44613.1 hypothetical protein SAMN04515666_111173 [Bosea lupini]